LRSFLTLGAGALDCRYTFAVDPDDRAAAGAFINLFATSDRVHGGACVGPAHELPRFAQSCADRAEVFVRAHDTDRADQWVESLPVIALSNGDYVALDIATAIDPDDPPVLYLSHDEDNVHLADSFTDFLTAWEHLCYIGPEIWLLDRFFGNDDLLVRKSPEVDQLRWLLGVPNVEA
jgi:hypothetical protein